jgi:hypothetical protein
MAGWAEHHSVPAKIPEAVAHIRMLAADARVRRAFPVPVAEMERLLLDQSMFVAFLDRLPRTLCHHDAAQANLFALQREGGAIETVAIDWESIGHGALGAEIATLVFGTIRRGDFPAEQAANLDHEVFTGYLQGLRDAG